MTPLTAEVLAARGAKNAVDPWRPYHFLVEPEVSRFRELEDVATIFLTNRECPFRCVFCDLWKNTLDQETPRGAVPAQIDFALRQLPASRHIKLYNSGNFFDSKAILKDDWPAIAERVQSFSTVIVENHPKLCSEDCDRFQQLIGTQLEVAMGLETSHEETLRSMNKQMTTQDFAAACELLRRSNILIRSFVLLKPPETTEHQAIERAVESVRFAINCGADCVSVIPVRTGNGWLDQQLKTGRFEPPKLSSLESVLSECLSWSVARVFADLWDVRQFADDRATADAQIARLHAMNITQRSTP